MPEHIHLLVSEPEEKNPSTVMQALKLGFARRVLAREKRNATVARPSVRRCRATHLAKAVLRFQCLDGTETHREAALYASQSGEARVGCVAGTMEVEQFSRLLSRRSGERKGNAWEVLKMKIRPPAA